MSQDGKTTYGISGQMVGFIAIAIGFAVLVASYMTKNFWLVIPVALIEIGFYGLAMGAFGELRGQKAGAGGYRWGTDPAYTMFWGSLLILVGALWLVNDAFPNNLAALAAAFMIWFGAAMMIMTRRKEGRPRVW